MCIILVSNMGKLHSQRCIYVYIYFNLISKCDIFFGQHGQWGEKWRYNHDLAFYLPRSHVCRQRGS